MSLHLVIATADVRISACTPSRTDDLLIFRPRMSSDQRLGRQTGKVGLTLGGVQEVASVSNRHPPIQPLSLKIQFSTNNPISDALWPISRLILATVMGSICYSAAADPIQDYLEHQMATGWPMHGEVYSGGSLPRVSGPSFAQQIQEARQARKCPMALSQGQAST